MLESRIFSKRYRRVVSDARNRRATCILTFGHLAYIIMPYGKRSALMSAAIKPESADLVEIKSRLRAGVPGNYYFVALLGLRNYEPLKIDARVRSGLSFSSLERFQRNTALSSSEIAVVIRLPARTWARRKETGRLEPDESDRLLRATRVFGRALELFEGDADAARVWLLGAQPLLGNLIPFELAGTDIGALEVERLIGRLEHGIAA
jgi:putative toxin-antitoxin system antitoxin component (TIGR02293 family)